MKSEQRSASHFTTHGDGAQRTDWQDGLSSGYLIGDVKGVPVKMVGHGTVPAPSMMVDPCRWYLKPVGT